ncbi:MAG: metallophosphoesterase family protein [Acidimicrobiales bacterium]
MTTFFSSDFHFGHQNIISYCRRPYHSLAEMNNTLVANWNALVGPHDVVHVLGDVAMGRRDETLRFVSQLAGRKVLYPGNHDRCWYGHGPSAADFEKEYLDAGFDEIRQGPYKLRVAGRLVTLCHLPYRGDSGDTDRFSKFRPVDEGLWLLHGHVHDKWRQHGRMINVGVDVWDFAPVSEDAVAALMDAEANAADRAGVSTGAGPVTISRGIGTSTRRSARRSAAGTKRQGATWFRFARTTRSQSG